MQTNIIRRQDMTICLKKGPDQSHKDLSIIRYTIEEEKILFVCIFHVHLLVVLFEKDYICIFVVQTKAA